MKQNLMTALEIWESKKIYWITTYKTLLKYISKDYVQYFKPIVKGSGSGRRYYVKTENIDDFVKKFESNELAK